MTAATAALAALAAQVPVDPDRPTATRWLARELSRPEYAQDESLLLRLVEWLEGLFDGIDATAVGTGQLAVVVLLVVAVVVGLAWWLAGPVRLRRRRAAASIVVHEDDPRTAAQMRAAADAAAVRDDWTTAVLERFRAVVRELEERVVLDELPGRTAVEAARQAGDRLPDLAGSLRAAATLFDGVCYGHLPASAADDAVLRRLDAQVQESRPVPAGAVVA
ncbi:uncharacterized protein DUF4129 [Isoptericola jiangsuensis]|uniref:Uncharacterized protein DUF4129 n=1 Tax=Isoptericola jiangsuensis TaxID=548579 RepID=A0A2A9EY95_9MICO|nr:DUF4129 domain-containing protein [Isoptericola jiangsuensis]PFG44034.1 uncharacterized protein DUF4129 [Isoptericola jiangsuensis]